MPAYYYDKFIRETCETHMKYHRLSSKAEVDVKRPSPDLKHTVFESYWLEAGLLKALISL